MGCSVHTDLKLTIDQNAINYLMATYSTPLALFLETCFTADQNTYALQRHFNFASCHNRAVHWTAMSLRLTCQGQPKARAEGNGYVQHSGMAKTWKMKNFLHSCIRTVFTMYNVEMIFPTFGKQVDFIPKPNYIHSIVSRIQVLLLAHALTTPTPSTSSLSLSLQAMTHATHSCFSYLFHEAIDILG